MKAIDSIALVVNPQKELAIPLSEEIHKHASALGVHCEQFEDYPLPEGKLEGFDICCVIGGDGTILGAVPEAARSQTAILGVNLGKLGFLAVYTPESIIEHLPSIVKGEYLIEKRSILECSDRQGQTSLALNDVVIRNNNNRLMQLVVKADGHFVNDYSCDGLIFAAPTGSTAYNLSAGGPIVHPGAKAITMTPICPHTLSNRSFIFPYNVTLTVECDCDSYEPQVNADGRHFQEGQTRFPLQIKTAALEISLIHDVNYSHYNTVRTKLHWA